MRTWGESKISSCCFCVCCKSRELGGRGSPRFPCVTPVVQSFSSDLPRAITSYWAESHFESCQTFTMELSWEKANGFNTLTISAEKLHRRCSTGLRTCFRLNVLSSWGLDGLQVYGISSRSLVYSEVVEARSSYNY